MIDTMFFLKFIVIFFGGIVLLQMGINFLIARHKSRPSEKRGDELLQKLRNNPYDVRKILGEMRFIAETNSKLYIEYCANKKRGTIDTLLNFSTIFKRQSELPIEMNHNVKAEWNPRLLFLKEIENEFFNDSDLDCAFQDCKKIDDEMQRLTLTKTVVIGVPLEMLGTYGGIALKAAKLGAIVAIPVAGVLVGMTSSAAKDIGKTKYKHW